MYLSHFGLSESPFAITPDPRFVFLSERHREALAHLLYGLGEGGGFVLLTGEVGTGKTTICRTLLEQLPEQVDVALVFNPQLTVLEFLDSVCTELGITPPEDTGDSIKARIDRLYAYLLDANARGRRTVLIIDEAQNLDRALLEEVRLLTNLETDRAKLLQVFLIGQPELRDKLAREDLRQLDQRITARYHLEPLDLAETRHYVRHRLGVSGCPREVFTGRALRLVHRLSKGTPRRINNLCDRALLGAYTLDAARVGAGIVRRAAAEVGGRHGPAARSLRLAAGVAGLLAAALLAGWQHPDVRARAEDALAVWLPATAAPVVPAPAASGEASDEPTLAVAALTALSVERELTVNPPGAGAEPDTPDIAAPAAPLGDAPAVPAAAPATPPSAPTSSAEVEPSAPAAPDLVPVGVVVSAAEQAGRESAIAALARQWNVPSPLPGTDVCTWAIRHELACYERTADWEAVRELDLPAVLRFQAGDLEADALVVAQAADRATFDVDGVLRHVSRAEVERVWRGDFLLFWRPPVPRVHQIMRGHSGERVRWLRDTLAAIDGRELSTAHDTFGAVLETRVKDFQRERGLHVDGIVGPETFVHIIRASSTGRSPSLSSPDHDVVAAAPVALDEPHRP